MGARTRRRRGDEGATLVTAAVLVTAVAAFAGLLLAGGSVYAAAQEGRRAADLAALAAAANLPTLNLSSGADPNPLGLPSPGMLDRRLGAVGIDRSTPLPTLGEDFLGGACAVAARQFGDGRSPITDSFGTEATTCSPMVHLANPWLQQLVDCLAGAAATTGCAADLAYALGERLPAPRVTDPVVAALTDAVREAGLAGQVVTSTLLEQIRTLDTTLNGALQPLLTHLNETGGVSVDVARLAPALVSPNVSVTVTQTVDVPGAGLVGAGPVTLTQTSTARRTFKNAVVVPVVDAPLPDRTISFDANPRVAAARDKAFTALHRVADRVTPAADEALREVACRDTFAACPAVSTTFDDLMADLRDVVDPPPGTAPHTTELIDHAIAQQTPILVATAAYATDPRSIVGATVYDLPVVKQLLPGLLFIPALDVVPAVLSAGPLGRVVATPVDTAVAAARTKGLYRARLVD